MESSVRTRERRRAGRRFFDAERNARLVANAERYYRVMYYGSRTSWNLRDGHMFDTLVALLEQQGEGARAVVWEHNSHVGDASATEMGARGELNVGQLARERFGAGAYRVGFGTHAGTVAAAHDWGEPMEVMRVRPSTEGSWERLFHASLARQFDEYVWFDRSRAVTPLSAEAGRGPEETFPFGL